MLGMAPAGPRALTLKDPAVFLRFLAANPTEIDLTPVTVPEMWSLAAVAALAREDRRPAPLKVIWEETKARGFARAVGFDDVVAAVRTEIAGEEGKTVRLTEVWAEEDVEPASGKTAQLLAGEDPKRQSARYALQYVIAELLRNVLQHSGSELGAITGAQLNARGIHEDHPAYQVVVVDNGRGIRASLSDLHSDIDSDEVALERSLWPHFSRAFQYGRTGKGVNAGLGLFYVSELAKELGGRLLIASGDASLFIDTTQATRQQFLPVGYSPGTLVAFEIPVETPRDFGELFEEIGRRAEERTPKRLVQERLRYDAPPPRAIQFLVSEFLENNTEARKLAEEQLVPRLARKESVCLNFANVRLCTQSFAHALLFEPLRVSWATRTPIYVLNAAPVVRSALRHVEMYSQSG